MPPGLEDEDLARNADLLAEHSEDGGLTHREVHLPRIKRLVDDHRDGVVLAIGLDFVAKEQIVSQFVVVKLIHIQITGLGDLGSVVNGAACLRSKRLPSSSQWLASHRWCWRLQPYETQGFHCGSREQPS